jgi:hypothetical protein
MSTAENPFSAPIADDIAVPLDGLVDPAEAERIRREHISHEVSVKSIGLLYYLATFFLGLASIGFAFALVNAEEIPGLEGAEYMLPIFVVFAIIYGVVGYGIRSLASWSKIPVIFLSALSLLSIPIGTLIGGYILYLVLCAKGKVVLSPQYKEIIRQTPHVKYKTPLSSWIALFGLVLILVVLFVVIAMM